MTPRFTEHGGKIEELEQRVEYCPRLSTRHGKVVSKLESSLSTYFIKPTQNWTHQLLVSEMGEDQDHRVPTLSEDVNVIMGAEDTKDTFFVAKYICSLFIQPLTHKHVSSIN